MAHTECISSKIHCVKGHYFDSEDGVSRGGCQWRRVSYELALLIANVAGVIGIWVLCSDIRHHYKIRFIL